MNIIRKCGCLVYSWIQFTSTLSDGDVFFFYKQKTAYEMHISDWSSDVCSSDLTIHNNEAAGIGLTSEIGGYMAIPGLLEAAAKTHTELRKRGIRQDRKSVV